MQLEIVKTQRFAPLEVKIFELTPAFAGPPNPGVSLEANASMPASLGTARLHQFGVDQASLG
jgi:hypothetical protein